MKMRDRALSVGPMQIIHSHKSWPIGQIVGKQYVTSVIVVLEHVAFTVADDTFSTISYIQ
jgi:hypothetical protein